MAGQRLAGVAASGLISRSEVQVFEVKVSELSCVRHGELNSAELSVEGELLKLSLQLKRWRLSQD